MAKAKFWMKGAKAADSKFEGRIRDTYLQDWNFQGDKVPYTIQHNYTPDFVRGKYIIETKGRFRDSAEARKYIHIREALEEQGRELVFLFSNANTFFPFAKARKDGTKQTQVEWANKNGFKYYTEETIGEFLEQAFEATEER